jgi:hypothetical protein
MKRFAKGKKFVAYAKTPRNIMGEKVPQRFAYNKILTIDTHGKDSYGPWITPLGLDVKMYASKFTFESVAEMR